MAKAPKKPVKDSHQIETSVRFDPSIKTPHDPKQAAAPDPLYRVIRIEVEFEKGCRVVIVDEDEAARTHLHDP